MMLLLLKILLLLSLGFIFIQDYKDRSVYWFLFPIVAVCCGILYTNAVLFEIFAYSVLLNLCFVTLLLLVIFIYAKVILKKPVHAIIGLGDILLFFGFAFSFSTISFITVFCFALLFALVMHLLLKGHHKQKTVPLAGYIGVFFGFVFIAQWLGLLHHMYSI